MQLKDLRKMTEGLEKTEKMPVLFLGHGSPMNAIDDNEFVKGFRDIEKTIPKPSAILVVSAHWLTKGTAVTAMENPPTIHDFGGFPKELYEVQYPALGSPQLAAELTQIITSTTVHEDTKWGLDHGAWSVIRHMYPAADIPVIQMSIDYYKPPRYHYHLARELSILRTRGVLIVGSGNIVHNLRAVAWDKINEGNFGFDWALEVREKINRYIMEDNIKPLLEYESGGNAFRMAIPTPDHFYPLLYTLGLRQKGDMPFLFNDKAVGGSLTMTSLKLQ